MPAGVLSTNLYVVKTFFEEFILQLKVQNLEKKPEEWKSRNLEIMCQKTYLFEVLS